MSHKRDESDKKVVEVGGAIGAFWFPAPAMQSPTNDHSVDGHRHAPSLVVLGRQGKERAIS